MFIRNLEKIKQKSIQGKFMKRDFIKCESLKASFSPFEQIFTEGMAENMTDIIPHMVKRQTADTEEYDDKNLKTSVEINKRKHYNLIIKNKLGRNFSHNYTNKLE